jgi:hypothetical protein
MVLIPLVIMVLVMFVVLLLAVPPDEIRVAPL